MYPINDMTGNISYTTIFREEATNILSFYNSSNSLIEQDVLSLMNPFKIYDWILIGSAMATFLILLLIGRRCLIGNKRIKAADTVWEVLTYWLDQDLSHSQFLYDRIVSILMTVFLFFGMAWLTNNMSTDLMVATDVESIQNYEQVLAAGEPIIMQGMAQWSEFRDSAKDSIEHRIFEKVLEQGPNGTGTFKSLSTAGGMKFLESAAKGYKHRTIILSTLFSKLMRRLYCSLFLNEESMPQYKDIKVLVRYDERARTPTQSFIYNKYSTPEKFQQILQKT